MAKSIFCQLSHAALLDVGLDLKLMKQKPSKTCHALISKHSIEIRDSAFKSVLR